MFRKKNIKLKDELVPPSPTKLKDRRRSSVLFNNMWDIQLRPVQKEKKEEKPKVFFFKRSKKFLFNGVFLFLVQSISTVLFDFL